MQNKNEMTTRDIYLASTLTTLRFNMTRISFQVEGASGKPVGYFSFENTPELREAERDYWQSRLAVEPRAFVTSLRGLKAQLTNYYKSPYSTH